MSRLRQPHPAFEELLSVDEASVLLLTNASLRKLEEHYVAVSTRLAEAMSANLRRDMTEIAAHAQNLGVEASVRVASMMGEFASSMGAGSGLATVRGASARMAMLASGVLAGIADALRAYTEPKEGK